MVTALVGIVIGTFGAYFVGRAMQGMWYGVEADRSRSRSASWPFCCSAPRCSACLVPARRAASVDPMVALRQD